jgi:GTP-binding protein
MAVGRIYQGTLKTGSSVFIKKPTGETRTGKIVKMFSFKGLKREETDSASSGDIVLIAGLPDIYIGETITNDESMNPLPAIAIDEPTIVLNFYPNSSPFAGKEGKFVTTRQIRERLENMRREGFELMVSQPKVIFHEENGVKTEPFEEVVIDTPSEYQGAIIERLGLRGFVMQNMTVHENQVRLIFEGPTRGLLGYKNQFVIDTKGEGILSSRFIAFKHFSGEIKKRLTGSMVSMETGKALGFSLWNLQDRGTLYIGPTTEVYEGMIIGNTSKGEEMMVNPTKGKQLTNMRASGSDEAINITPPWLLSIERGLEVMGEDEFLEITPSSVRLRKQYLTDNERAKARRTTS